MLLTDPLGARERRALRSLVLGLRRRTSNERTRFALRVCVGGPDAVTGSLVVGATDRLDLTARTEVLCALLDAAVGPAPWVWIERRGVVDWHAADSAWLAATLQAGAESRRDLAFVVVTRTGWRDPRSGAGRTWVRPRERRPGAAA